METTTFDSSVEIKLSEPLKEVDPIQEFQEWIHSLPNKKAADGCFFVLNETIYPYFWNNSFFPNEVSLEEAWDVICTSWLNPIYKTVLPLQKLEPFILKGYVKDGTIYMGHNCPYYLPDIKFCFNITHHPKIVIDHSISINPEIPREILFVLKSMIKDCPYFENLPKRIQFRRRDFGLDKEREAAGRSVITQICQIRSEKRSRLGAMPKLTQM